MWRNMVKVIIRSHTLDYPEDGRSKLLLFVGTYVPVYTVLCRKRRKSSRAPLWRLRIWHAKDNLKLHDPSSQRKLFRRKYWFLHPSHLLSSVSLCLTVSPVHLFAFVSTNLAPFVLAMSTSIVPPVQSPLSCIHNVHYQNSLYSTLRH